MKYLLFLSFLTSVPAFFGQTITLAEDFENGIPATWAVVVVDTNTVESSVSEFAPGWIGIAEPNDTANHVAAATSYFNYVAQANRMLILPKLTMSGYGNLITWRARSQDPSYPDSYQILVSTTDSLVSSFTDTVYNIIYEGEFWTSREVNLSDSGYVNQDIYVAINLNSINAYKLYIDDVQVRVQDPLRLNEVAKVQMNVYPNPATDFVAVTADAPIKALAVYDLSGKNLISGGDPDKLDVSALNSGVYIVQVDTDAGTVSKKLIRK